MLQNVIKVIYFQSKHTQNSVSVSVYIQGTLCKDIDKNGFCFNIIPVQQTIPYFLSSQSMYILKEH